MIARTYVAVDPKTGRHLRNATTAETAAYDAANVGERARPFDRPVLCGDVLVEVYTGPGGAHTPGRFL